MSCRKLCLRSANIMMTSETENNEGEEGRGGEMKN